MPTTWTNALPASTPWSVVDDTAPQIFDGGNATTIAWLGVYDGGGAVALSDIISGAAPQRTIWDALSARIATWITLAGSVA